MLFHIGLLRFSPQDEDWNLLESFLTNDDLIGDFNYTHKINDFLLDECVEHTSPASSYQSDFAGFPDTIPSNGTGLVDRIKNGNDLEMFLHSSAASDSGLSSDNLE